MSQNAPSSAVAAVYVTPGAGLEIRKYPLTGPRGDFVRLGLVCSGICGTDMHIVRGRLPIPPPFIPGHEFLGRVDAIGPRARKDALGKPLKVGDLVIACVARPCGKCFTCRQGLTASCLNFGVTNLRTPEEPPHLFGGFAEALYQPAGNVVKVPSGVAAEVAAAFACAGPTVFRALAYAGPLKKGDLVVVQGTGPVGLFAIAFAAQAGCKVVAIGSVANPLRAELAKRLGASLVLDYRAGETADRTAAVASLAKRLNRGNGADVAIEASGAPKAIEEGLQLVRTLGRYIIPGQYSVSGPVEIRPELITFRALRIIGSGQYTLADLAAYLTFLRRGRKLQSRLAECITHRYRVDQANQALADADAGQMVKGVFVCQ